MDKKKDLKVVSIVILALLGLSLIRMIVGACINGIPQIQATEGLTKEMIQVASIIAFALTFVFLLPQVYIGVKGIKIANGGAFGKAPFVWTIILAILAAVATVSAIADMFKVFNFDTILLAVDCALDVALYVCYYLCIRNIAKAK